MNPIMEEYNPSEGPALTEAELLIQCLSGSRVSVPRDIDWAVLQRALRAAFPRSV